MAVRTLIPLALAACGSAAILPRDPEPGFLSFPLTHAARDTVIHARDETVTVYNESSVTYLFALKIGTPPQEVKVVLDTGSFELWVGPTCSGASTQDQTSDCEAAGTYDPNTSSTVVDEGVTGSLSYGKGDVEVAYVADSIQVPGTGSSKTLSQVIFGFGQGSKDLTYGIAGVGHGYEYNLQYNNLIDELAAQGVTKSKAFSVALGSKDVADGGSVVFGGVDTKKFTGPLYRFDNLPPQEENGQTGSVRYWIQLDSVGVTKPSGAGSTVFSDSALPIVLDTGATMCYLPQAIIDDLAQSLDATVQQDGTLMVDCDKMTQSGTVDFAFGNLTLHVPYHEFLWEVSPGQCFVGAAPVGKTTPILGDTFIRSAYVVFDQTNSNIYLARYQNCGTKEQTLSADPGAAGNFTGDCTPPAANSSSSSAAAGGHGGSAAVAAWLAAGVLMQLAFFLL